VTTTARRGEAAAAAAIYAALTVVFTWPLARGLAGDVPGDFGDPLLNAWILAWNATHLAAGWRAWWSANIFHPHPLALAYSEHLAAPAIQILPIYWLTANPLLCYNLLYLSTFVLSGLGVFLFVRELTGSRSASFLAGLAYAFAPYRAGALPHLQVLSSAWMPFVLFGFHRYFSTRRVESLAFAAVAWVAQNLSCGYYLLFFAPVVGFYLVWEITARRLWRDARVIMSVAVTCAIVVAATLPFLLPYLELRRLGFSPRSLVETQKFSADVYAYFTADPSVRVWGAIASAWPRAENALFPGLTVTLLAAWAALKARAALKGCATGTNGDGLSVATETDGDAVSVAQPFSAARADAVPADAVPADAVPVAQPFRAAEGDPPARSAAGDVALVDGASVAQPFRAARSGPRGIRAALVVTAATALAIIVALLLGFSIRLPGLKITSLGRALAVAVVAAAATIAFSRAVRRDVAAWLRTPAGFFALLTLFAIAMSFGPAIHAKGRVVLDPNVYAFFYRFVPGYDGLRVPARFGMIVALSLSVLAGLGLSTIGARRGASRVLTAMLAAAIAVESFAASIPVNEASPTYTRPGLALLPRFERHAPPVYDFVRTLPPGSAIVELPLGEPAFDVRYMFFSINHWKPLVNGYTGGRPADYELLDQMLQDLFTRPERAWTTLRQARPTHAIVHESFYADGRGVQVSQWLRANGAREVAAFGADRVFALP
jgi:hypothetical protein